MSNHYLLLPGDIDTFFFLLRSPNARGRYDIPKDIQPAPCLRCNKGDEEELLKRNRCNVDIDTSSAFFTSGEDLYIARGDLLKEFQSLFGDCINSYPILPSGDYFAVFGTVVYKPKLGDVGFRFGRQCPECRRFREIVWDRDTPPCLPQPKPLLSVSLEGVMGLRQVWLVTDAVAKDLRKLAAKHKSMYVIKKSIVVAE
ncbi:MAG: hypothetical protein ACRC8S_17185 [Fimbriiglobus sp.]